jgi:N-methylhydantoinase A/oxoprolinase/acetone carboxylase beta subunit
MKGYDAAAHVLACFGGAGGQHACAIAHALGMSTIFVHRWGRAGRATAAWMAAAPRSIARLQTARLQALAHTAGAPPLAPPTPPPPYPPTSYAGILSAVGIHLADIVAEAQEPAAVSLGAAEVRRARRSQSCAHASAAPLCCSCFTRQKNLPCPFVTHPNTIHPPQVLQQLSSRLDALAAAATTKLEGQGFSGGQIRVERFLNLRWALGGGSEWGGAAQGDDVQAP